MTLPKLEDLMITTDSACYIELKCKVQSTSPLVEYGVVYQEGNTEPLLQNGSIRKGLDIIDNSFSIKLEGLKPSTFYSIRAYSKTKDGIGYSRIKQLTTLESPQVQLSYSINTDTVLFQGAIVKFSNKSTGANSYEWEFGDGQKSNLAEISYTYNSLGAFSTKLKGEKQGCKFTKEVRFEIIENPFKDYWVDLPGGDYMMGCTNEQLKCDPNEKPVHLVKLDPFQIGKTEVTQKQWLAIMGYRAGSFTECGPDCPVELVDFFNIVRNFIPILNRKTGRVHRLPTEAEWEYAAKGGQNYIYAGSDTLDLVGWGENNSNQKSHPVAQKRPNGFGLYDMTGNVWEWCSDYYAPSYYQSSPMNNPQGPSSTSSNFRVRRGGGFRSTNYELRASYRQQLSTVQPVYTIGFRLVRTSN